jgi:hypothetical protein
MATRAVHLVVAESMSTPHFLNALRIFENLRTKPDEMYSDNGLNFVGAEKVLKPVWEKLVQDDKLEEELVQRGIAWKRYVPRAPHFGGVHEALIKSVKRALHHCMDTSQKRRSSGQASAHRRYLTESELNVLFAEVTGFLNNRPLTYVSSHPKDGILTPSYFLMPGGVLQPLPGVDSSYALVKELVNKAWKVRKKLSLGKFEEVYKGKDGYVRAVLVKTEKGLYCRPIVKCCLLQASDRQPVRVDPGLDEHAHHPVVITEVDD